MSVQKRKRQTVFKAANGDFAVTENRAAPATEAQVRALEKRLGERLPDDYRRFLLTINGGRRPGGSWLLPRVTDVDTFRGLRRDHYSILPSVENVLRQERVEGALLFSDAFGIAYDSGANPFVLRFRGPGKGSVWYWSTDTPSWKRRWRPQDGPIPTGDVEWLRVAPSFTAFLRRLRQKPDPPRQAELRKIFDADDVKAMEVLLDPIAAEEIDERDEATSQTLLQRAANAGAIRIVRLLLRRGAKGLAGLGTVLNQGHDAVAELLLKSGYEPTKYDWGGVVASGRPKLLRTFLRLARRPSRTELKMRLGAARNLLRQSPSRGRGEIVRILEELVKGRARVA